MRKLNVIEQDITRCQAQLAATFNTAIFNKEDAVITREGLSIQYNNLIKEKDQAIKQIHVIDPQTIEPGTIVLGI